MPKWIFRDTFRDTLVITNSFIHDMATGIWIGALIVMKVTIGEAERYAEAMVVAFSQEVLALLWWVSVIGLIVMLLTGAARVFTLKYYGWTGDIAKGRKRLLIIKHVMLSLIMLVGLYLQINVYLGM